MGGLVFVCLLFSLFVVFVTGMESSLDSGGVTGGVYKARERIHRGVLIRDY